MTELIDEIKIRSRVLIGLSKIHANASQFLTSEPASFLQIRNMYDNLE